MEPLELVGFMGRIFDSLDVPWVLGGSMASSISGEPRSTMDIDMAVRLDLGPRSGISAAATTGGR